MPKVSIIIPNYNHAQYLRQRIDSVFGQTYQDFELILLDDCSTDQSCSILNEYSSDPRVRIVLNNVNSGSTFKQWNKGVRQARGEYVWIAESDDYAEPQLLERLVSRLDAGPTLVLCNCRSWRVSPDGETLGFLDSYLAHLDKQRWTTDFCADGREECRTYLVRCCTILNASSVVFRRDVFERVGGADETLRQCGDWKLWAAMALEGKIAYLGGQPLNYHREHDTSVTSTSQRTGVFAAESLQVIRWILERVTLPEETRSKVFDDVFQLWYYKGMRGDLPFGRRWAILMSARAVDEHALQRLLRQLVFELRVVISRRYRSLKFGV